jgi:NAD(P)-dependent dehydrogenase (short-subunit alcohol dehydrogenase family)
LPSAERQSPLSADIANAVAFLVSPVAGFINGANLRVDGGNVQSVN